MGIWDIVGDIGLGVATGGIGPLVKHGFAGEGPLSSLSGKADTADPYQIDPNGYEYGGRAGVADADAAAYRQQTQNALNQSGALQNSANGLQQLQGYDRNAQVDALNLQRQAALGLAPSRAELLAKAQSDRAVAAQQSAAASARTPAGIAMAQQQAAGNMMRAQTDIANNTAALRADEMANARGAYAGQTNALRGADLANQGLQQNAALGYQQAGQGWANQEGRVRQQQLEGSMGREGQRSANYNAVIAPNAMAKEAAAKRKDDMITDGANMAMSLVGAKSDDRVKNFTPGMQSSDGVKNMLGGGVGGTMGDMGSMLQQAGPMLPGQFGMGNSPQLLSTLLPMGMKMLSDERTKEYDTKLSPEEEAQFQAWRAKAVRPEDKGEDYDFRGAWKAGVVADPKNAHWPDTFKKPNHATFSDESQYAKGENYKKAGHWNGETFTSAKEQLAKDAKMMEKADGLGRSMAAMFAAPTAATGAKAPDPMMDKANAMQASQKAMYENPGPMEQYLASTRPATYTYKDGYGTPGVHVGPPSAQQMAANPIGATMVKPDPDGTLSIDPARAIKTNMGATAYVNDKAEAANRKADVLARTMAAMFGSPNATAGSLARVRGGK